MASMMRTKKISTVQLRLPLPLFDTLEHITTDNTNVEDYLLELNHPGFLHEYHLTKNFLQSYKGSVDTFNAYRRETERLLHYCQYKKMCLREFNRDELRAYLEFCQKPPKEWIAYQQFPRFIVKNGARIPNPDWRPFVMRATKAQHRHGIQMDYHDYQLSPKSQQALLATLSTFFNFLQQEEYLSANPAQLLRQKHRIIQRHQSRHVTRKLSRTQWHYVIETLEQLNVTNPQYERSLFIMSTFYLLGLRISELAHTPERTPKMSDFSPDKEGRWWFTTVGKGNKVRDVAVPDELLLILKRYRQSINLTPLPYRSETTPLIQKTVGRGGLGIRHIRKLVQDCFDLAISRLTRDGFIDEAEDLATATVHWLRHTSISNDVEFRPREHVRDDAGHGSATTTDQYIDIDRKARHDSARTKPLKPPVEKIDDV